jgi:acetyl-CoA C-acetyltransferase
MTLDPSTPVLVGVGVASHEGGQPEDGREASELMAAAVAAAAVDSGRPALLRAVQRVAVPRGTWSYADPGRLVAARIGSPNATTVLAELGIPQQTLISDALARIARGGLEVAVVVGGEAKRRAVSAERAGTKSLDTVQTGPPPDEHLRPEGEMVAGPEIKAGIWVPVQQ